ncbi:hypothetical protein [uncultured Sphingomonas sp.]|uniref:hypothetical protein n=1 Tax=uncultured Sphingomonas sp. TaxID=158754 RepID=UPI0035CA5EE7
MNARGVIVGIVAGALAAAGTIVAPAFGAYEQLPRAAKRTQTAARALGGFTPAAADPRLAALFARGGIDPTDFHFTPAESRRGNRGVTIAVRARSNQVSLADTTRLAAAAPATSIGLAPIAYNLGAAIGWKRLAISGDMGHVDLAGAPGSRDTADVAVTYAGRRLSGRLKAFTEHPLVSGPQLASEMPSYSVDVSSSYALTHNLNVTAGVRYRADRDRLAPSTLDATHDSQAVYLGTAFHF